MMEYYPDYSAECSMCGKQMSYRACGMCTTCEMIDTEVPDIPRMDYSVDGQCPQCGGQLEIQYTGGACGEHFQYCKDDVNCSWSSVHIYDC